MDARSTPPTAKTSLSATGVTVRFGGLVALADVSIDVPPGTIIGLVGPNGAGKSTLFGVLSGLLKPARGRVSMGGKDVTTVNAQTRARLGLAAHSNNPSSSWDCRSAITLCSVTGSTMSVVDSGVIS